MTTSSIEIHECHYAEQINAGDMKPLDCVDCNIKPCKARIMPGDIVAEFEVSLAWWFTWIYMPIIQFMTLLFFAMGIELHPNQDKLAYWLEKATKSRRLN